MLKARLLKPGTLLSFDSSSKILGLQWQRTSQIWRGPDMITPKVLWLEVVEPVYEALPYRGMKIQQPYANELSRPLHHCHHCPMHGRQLASPPGLLVLPSDGASSCHGFVDSYKPPPEPKSLALPGKKH